MDDQFQKNTKNNGLKNTEWGSDEFIKKLQQQEEQEWKRATQQRIDNAIAEIRGY